MKKNLSLLNFNALSSFKKRNVVLLVSLLFAFAQQSIATSYTWIGAATGGTSSNLLNQNNWTPKGVPTTGDICTINFTGTTGGALILNLSSGSSWSIGALTINLSTPAAASAVTTVNVNILDNLSISGALTINNTSVSSYNDSLIFNVGNTLGNTPGTVSCGSMTITADGKGNSATSLPEIGVTINTSSTLNCLGNWSSTSAANSYTSTLVQNSAALTIGGSTTLKNSGNSGKNTINFLVGNSPAITTFIGNTMFGATKDTVTYKDTVFIGGIKNSSTGTFAFQGINDTLGFNAGMTNFRNGTLLFNNATGTTKNIVSFASSDAPDRIPGILHIGNGSSIAPIVNFVPGTGTSDNEALTVSQSLIVDTGSTFYLRGIVTPSNANKVSPDGLVQIRAGAKLILGTKAGNSSSVPGNYQYYNFDRTSTVSFSGTTPQTIYSGVTYGNVIIADTSAGGVTAGGTLTIAGTLTINSGTSLNARASGSLIDTISVRGNWTNNGSFYSDSATIIFDSTTNTTISGSSTTNFYNLIVKKTGATVTMNKDVNVTDSASISSGILALNGNTLTSNNIVGNSSATISGTTTSGLIVSGNADNLYFTQSGTNNYLKTFTVSGSATLKNALNIAGGNSSIGYGTVTVNGTLNSNSFLTLKSDANGTALIGPSTGVINSMVTVERYFPPLRAWRFVSIPFSSTNQTINSAWQQGLVNSVLTCPSQYPGTPGIGTEISGGSSADGFDINNTGYASIKVYQNNAWVVPATTYTNLVTASSNNAYCLFVRGDRNVCLTYTAPADATTLSATGLLNQQGSSTDVINFNGAKPNDFILIGNPYAAPVDIRAAVKTNNTGISSDKFWVWNPTLGGANGVGGYVTFSNGVQVPFNLIDTTNYAANTILQSGESFMVQVNSSNTGGAGSLTFKETDKSTTETTVGVFGLKASPSPKSTPYTPPALYVNLLDQSNVVMDGVGMGFSNKYSVYIDSLDTQKKWNEEIENMAIVHHDTTLAIEFRPVPKQPDTMLIRLYLRQHPYTLQIFTKGVADDLPAEASLVDKYLGTQTPLDIHNVNLYAFTPNKDTNSYRNRFMIVFNRTGKKQQQEKGVTTSANAIAKSNLSSAGEVSIYPNPVTGSKAMLKFNDMPAGSYEVTIYNAAGEQLSVSTVQHTGINTVYPLLLKSSWNTGLLVINILNTETGVQNILKALISR